MNFQFLFGNGPKSIWKLSLAWPASYFPPFYYFRVAQPWASFLSRARPSEASSGPADTLPLCIPWTRHLGQSARLAPPFNSRRTA
jgi:hypothetical protein